MMRRSSNRVVVLALGMCALIALLGCGDSPEANAEGEANSGEMENAIMPDTALNIPDSAFVEPSTDAGGGADGAAGGTDGAAEGEATGAGANGTSDQQAAARGAAEEVLTGRVVSSGTVQAPMTVLQLEKGGPVGLIGDLEPELQRLAGATVRVAGTPSDRFPGGGLDVRTYEVISIDGTRPHVGILVDRNGTLWLADSDTLRLEGVPAELQGRAGAKVWITGRRAGDGLQIQSYGVIRD